MRSFPVRQLSRSTVFLLLVSAIVCSLSVAMCAEPVRDPRSSRRCPLPVKLEEAKTCAPVPFRPGDEIIRGKLQFKSRKPDFEGTNVGIVEDNRLYIIGNRDSPQRALWNYDKLPLSLKSVPKDAVPVTLTFSTFWLTKQTGSIDVVIRAVTHNCPQKAPSVEQKGEWQWASKEVDARGKTLKEQYSEALEALLAKKINPEGARLETEGWKAANELAEKYGFYEVRITNVIEHNEMCEIKINLPAGVFRNAFKKAPETDANGKPKLPLVTLAVKCEAAGLLIGFEESDCLLTDSSKLK